MAYEQHGNNHKPAGNRKKDSGKKPFNNKGKNGKPNNKFGKPNNDKKPFKKKEVSDTNMFLKHADPKAFTKIAIEDDGFNATELLEKSVRGNIYKGFHLYKVYISVNNRFVSGFSFKQVGWLTFHKETKPGAKDHFSSVTMHFIPKSGLNLDSKAIAELEIQAYMLGKELMAISSKAVNFYIPEDVAKENDFAIKKTGFIDSRIVISDIYGYDIGDGDGYKCYTSYTGGVPVNIKNPSDNDIFVTNYVKNNMHDVNVVIKPNMIILTKEEKTLAKIFKLQKDKKTKKKTISYEVYDDNFEDAVKKFILNGVKNENRGHKNPYDPINKIDIVRINKSTK